MVIWLKATSLLLSILKVEVSAPSLMGIGLCEDRNVRVENPTKVSALGGSVNEDVLGDGDIPLGEEDGLARSGSFWDIVGEW